MKWLWPEDYKKLGFNISLSGKINKIIVNKYNLDENKIEFRNITDYDEKKKILLNNIHYEEIDKENYWNEEPTNIAACKKNILSKKLLNVDMIECTSNGLSEDNIKRLYKELKK